MNLNRLSALLFAMASVAWLVSAGVNAATGKNFALSISLAVVFAAVGFVFWKIKPSGVASDKDSGSAVDE